MVDERFWRKVNKAGACWLWTGALFGKGYGAVARRKLQHKNFLAHRYAWMLTHGPIPDGLLVLHKCDVPACVNPAHLMLGTHKDNFDDMIAKRRGNWARGEKQRSAKLTDAEVIKLRQLVADGMTQKEAARIYNIRPHTVSVIISRKTWRHV